MKNLSIKLLAFALLGLVVISCDDNDDNKTSELTLNFTGLEDLGADYKYEGWIIVDGSPVTTGVFTVDAEGNQSENVFEINSEDLENATTFVLTIEPSPDNDPKPSDVHVLAGDFSGNNASLTIGHEAALGSDFTSAKGGYILATPTDGDGDMDEDSGVWFLDNSSGAPAVGLDLPTLPAGWAYEGWAVINGTPVSTGTFTDPTAADDAAPYSGTAGGPPFPGEDFLLNAPEGLTFPTSLAGGAVVVSIEPVPDNSSKPFRLKPLFHGVDASPATHTFTTLQNNIANTAITGSAAR